MVEFLIVSILVLPLLLLYAQYATENAAAETNRAVASHAKMISRAVERYQTKHHVAILDATISGPVTITLAMLRSTGALPTYVAPTNSYGQTYDIRARRVVVDGAPVVEIMVATINGSVIADKDLRSIAGMVEGGGYFSETRPTVAQGAQGGWEIAGTQFGLSPGAGRLAVALFFNAQGRGGQAATEDYLYRNYVPGRPEVNRMNTNIDMGDNDINVVNNIETRTLYVANHVAAGQLQTFGNSGWYNTTHQGGFYMSDPTWIRSYNSKNLSMEGGQINAGTIDAGNLLVANKVHSRGDSETDGWHYTNGFQYIGGVATSGWGCSPNGLQGRTSSGDLLSCVDGIWRPPGGVGFSPTGGMGAFPINGSGTNTTPWIWFITIFNAHDKDGEHRAWVDGQLVVNLEGGGYSIKQNGSFIVKPGQSWTTQAWGRYLGTAVVYW